MPKWTEKRETGENLYKNVFKEQGGNTPSGSSPKTAKDGRTYYLNPDPAKGVEGEMMTGWVEIGGIWYYFNPNPDGTRGSLLRTSNTNPF